MESEHYAELQPVNGNMLVNEPGPPGNASLASLHAVTLNAVTELRRPMAVNEQESVSLTPLQAVPISVANGYPSQHYYGANQNQDQFEDTGNNSVMIVSPGNEWMMKC